MEVLRESRRRKSPGIRRCLRCGRKFRSEWIGNRICPRCREINRNLYPGEVYRTGHFGDPCL